MSSPKSNDDLNEVEETKIAHVSSIEKINHYKEMGVEDTSVLKKISSTIGFTMAKKKKGIKSKALSKSITIKKKTGQNIVSDMANAQQ